MTIDPVFLNVVLNIVTLIGLFFMLKYRKKLPNPLGFVADRAKSFANGIINAKIESLLKDVTEHPEILANLMQKPLRLLVDDMIKNPPKGLAGSAAQLQSTGNTLVDIAQVVLPMFGAKGRMAAAALPLLPLLKKEKTGDGGSKSPFDR